MRKLIYILPLIALTACSDNKDQWNTREDETRNNCQMLYGLIRDNISPRPSYDNTVEYCECYSHIYAKFMDWTENKDITREDKMKFIQAVIGTESKEELNEWEQEQDMDYINGFIATTAAINACGTLANPTAPEKAAKWINFVDNKTNDL